VGVDGRRPALAEPARWSGPRAAFAAAAAVVVFALGAWTHAALRGLDANGVRALKADADVTGDIALARQKYERIVREGSDKPECTPEVEDSLTQILAIRGYEHAAATRSDDARRVELLDVISRFPEARATMLAVPDYVRLTHVNPKEPPAGGFDKRSLPGYGPLALNETVVHSERDLENVLTRIDGRQKREIEGVLATRYLQKALQETDRTIAKADLARAVELADPSSPTYLAAVRRRDALATAAGN
jgi:hypothetical protein